MTDTTMETKHATHDKIQRLRPTPRWSDATIFNGIVHFVEVPADTEQDMTSQIVQIFGQTESTLAEIGSNKSHLLSATVYLAHTSNVAIFNQLWEAWLPKNSAPSRTCVKVELLDPKMLIEIAFVAVVETI
jgi:enamine deaminase RidA (YjgF/YER057c/UK114 family)